MKAKASSTNPTKQAVSTPPKSAAIDREAAALAAEESAFWTLRNVPPDVRVLVARAIRDAGRDKKFWIVNCVRAALAKKRDVQAQGLKPCPMEVVK